MLFLPIAPRGRAPYRPLDSLKCPRSSFPPSRPRESSKSLYLAKTELTGQPFLPRARARAHAHADTSLLSRVAPSPLSIIALELAKGLKSHGFKEDGPAKRYRALSCRANDW